MGELIERLREEPYPYEKRHGLGITAMEVWHKTACEAADEIERLSHNVKTLTANGKAIEAENERLRAALEKIKSHHMEAWCYAFQRGINFCAEIASEALGGSDE